MKKKFLTTGLAGAIALTSVLGVGSAAFADSRDGTSKANAPTAEQIAQRQKDHAEKLEERLSDLVEEGKITELQKQAIIDFFEENKPSIDKDASEEERKAAREAFKAALEEFAEENEIDLDLIMPAKGPGGRVSPEERKAQDEQRLAELVEDGTLTQEQADAIKEFREDNKPTTDPNELSEEERKAQREEMREAFEKFAEENDIDIDDIRPPHAKGEGPRGQNK